MADEEIMEREEETFQVLEGEFKTVLNQLAADQTLNEFRQQYERLHRALKVSHENGKILLAKCKQQSVEIQQSTTKVQHAYQHTKTDQESMSLLQQHLLDTVKQIQESQQRESEFKLKIENLYSEISLINQTLTRNKAAGGANAPSLHDLLIQQDELKKELELLDLQLSTNQEDLQTTQEKIEKQEQEKQKCIKSYDEIIQKREELEKQAMKDEDSKKQIQSEQTQIKEEYEQAKSSIQQLTAQKQKLEQDLKEQRRLIKKKKGEIEESNKEYKEEEKHLKKQRDKLLDIEKELEELSIIIEGLQIKYQDSQRELEELEKYQNNMRAEQEQLSNDVQRMNEQKRREDEIREITQSGINQLEAEINGEKRVAADDRSILEELRRNRDIQQKEIDRAENNNKRQYETKIAKDKVKKEKENEYQGLTKDMQRFQQLTKQLEKEKEKYGLQAAQANAKYFHSLEEIKLKDNLISEFQKKNIETEAKLKQQQNLYEAVRSDRNLYSKNLTETQEEIAEIKRRYKIVNHQISQLKEEIDSKEQALTKEHFDHKKKDTLIEDQAKSIKKYKDDVKEKEEKISNFIQQISKLHLMIKESEQQRQKLKEEYELVVAERDILGTQLIRRNTEAGLLYEKIKINQSTLKKGEVQYTEKLADIIILKSQIADLMNDIKVYKSQANSIGNMKNEIHNLSKELIEEKLKVKALSEELEYPMNVHRWRRLEATDSETYELMTKIQSLQKRLIQKTEESSQKDGVVKQRDKQLKDLRDFMRRQPGIEEEKMIPVYQQSLKQKTQQMRAMNGEMITYQSHLSEYKLEIDRLNKELDTTKKKYYLQKKKEQQKQDQVNQQQKAMQIQVNLPDKRFTGGGFNLAIYNN